MVPDCIFIHCILHGKALALKTLSPELMKVLKQVITLVNAVKSSALNPRLFRRFCKKMDLDPSNFLYHTEARWLSKGNVLKRVFELPIKLINFFTERKKEAIIKFLKDDAVLLAYLADIFGKLNELFISLQGRDKIIINFTVALSVFNVKLEL